MSVTEVDRAIRAVAAFGLDGVEEAGPIEVAPADWNMVRYRLSAYQLTGLGVAAWGAGALALGPAQAEELLEHHRAAMAWALRIERRLLQIREHFASNRVPFLVLKGPAVAHIAYPDPSLRSFGDLDLLLPANRFREGCEAVQSLGFSRRHPEMRRGYDERFGKAVTHRDAEGMDLDVHRTLAPGPFGVWIDAGDLHRRASTFEVGGYEVRRLDDTEMFLHACMHAALDGAPSLHSVRDIVQTAELPGVHWDEAAQLIRRWRLAAVVDRALQLVREHLGAPVGQAEILSLRPTPNERRLVQAYRVAERQRGSLTLETFRAISGLPNKAAFAASVAFPNRRFIESPVGPHRGEGYRTRWMRLTQGVLARGVERR